MNAGFAVAITDGVGYLNGQVHQHVIDASGGHAILDAARTATQVPGAGLTAGTKVGLRGYSEGGSPATCRCRDHGHPRRTGQRVPQRRTGDGAPRATPERGGAMVSG